LTTASATWVSDYKYMMWTDQSKVTAGTNYTLEAQLAENGYDGNKTGTFIGVLTCGLIEAFLVFWTWSINSKFYKLMVKKRDLETYENVSDQLDEYYGDDYSGDDYYGDGYSGSSDCVYGLDAYGAAC
jgi:hypothetical protein